MFQWTYADSGKPYEPLWPCIFHTHIFGGKGFDQPYPVCTTKQLGLYVVAHGKPRRPALKARTRTKIMLHSEPELAP